MSIGVFNLLEFLKFGVVVCRIFPMLPFQMQPEVGVGMGQLFTALIPCLLLFVLVTSITVLLTLRGFQFTPVFYEAVSATNYCITGVLSTCRACTNPVLKFKSGWFFVPILGSLGGPNTATVLCLIPIFRLLNKYLWEIPAVSPANWTCVSLPFTTFKLFPTSFIFKFATLLIRLFPTSYIVKF